MEKLTNTITLKLDDATLEKIDTQQRATEQHAQVPLKRALFVRMLLLAQLDILDSRGGEGTHTDP